MAYSPKTEKELIKLLKSGKFTVVFNDSNEGQIIYGVRYRTYDRYANDFEEERPYDSINFLEGGYGGQLTEPLVKALGGSLIST